ncbi:hypothetical protein KSP40_PGU001157 [Platanthera guangdongensis]|uniref:Protein ABA DEFICIENT 4, chloroplastic n=1 Tax=Platanthera guangdongensis TaxID=2320717 RepID=A0ABR2LQB6_9ASPA
MLHEDPKVGNKSRNRGIQRSEIREDGALVVLAGHMILRRAVNNENKEKDLDIDPLQHQSPSGHLNFQQFYPDLVYVKQCRTLCSGFPPASPNSEPQERVRLKTWSQGGRQPQLYIFHKGSDPINLGLHVIKDSSASTCPDGRSMVPCIVSAVILTSLLVHKEILLEHLGRSLWNCPSTDETDNCEIDKGDGVECLAFFSPLHEGHTSLSNDLSSVQIDDVAKKVIHAEEVIDKVDDIVEEVADPVVDGTNVIASSQIASSAFTWGTVAVLPFYTLMVLAPRATFTKKLMESDIPFGALGILYGCLLYLSWTPETLRVMFATKYLLPELPGITKMFANEMTMASAWIHLLAVDLFAARQVFHDGLKNNVETRHSVSLCLLFCPIGILSHVITKEEEEVHMGFLLVNSTPGFLIFMSPPFHRVVIPGDICVMLSIVVPGIEDDVL